MSSDLLADLTTFSKYARHWHSLGRRETFEEVVARSHNMHAEEFRNHESYDKIKPLIDESFSAVRDKKVLPSMRTLQFSGEAVRRNHIRSYNCSFLNASEPEFFRELMFLLMSGTGVGFSVQNHHITQLPRLVEPGVSRKYLIQDSIIGWSDAIDEIVKAYFYGTPKPRFDFSEIRAAGEQLKISGGKAPGPEPLRRALALIDGRLQDSLSAGLLRPIDVHDISCYIAEAVLSGGIRRCLPAGSRVIVDGEGFKPIEEIRNGDLVSTPDGWKPVTNFFDQGEQELVTIRHQGGDLRCTPNHRIAVLDDMDSVKWVPAEDLAKGDRMVFLHNESIKWENRLPDLDYEISPSVTRINQVVVPDLDEGIGWLIGMVHGNGYVYLSDTHGRVDVSTHSNQLEHANVCAEQLGRFGVATSVKEVRGEHTIKAIARGRMLADYFHHNVKQPNAPLRIPDFILRASPSVRLAYLHGVFDSDGSAQNRPVHLVTSVYPEFCRDIMSLASSLGIRTRYRPVKNKKDQPKYAVVITNEVDKHRFEQGPMPIKEIRHNKVGQRSDSYPMEMWKNSDLYSPSKSVNPSATSVTLDRVAAVSGEVPSYSPVKVLGVERIGEVAATYDIEVEDAHSFMCENVLVHNSAMISLFSPDDWEMVSAKTGVWWEESPQRAYANNSAVLLRGQDEHLFGRIYDFARESGSGEPGVSWTDDNVHHGFNPCHEALLRDKGLCNLTTINAGNIKTQEDLNHRAEMAAVIGTLQASYTDFHYLRPEWKQNADEEALLGISMTGIAAGNVLDLDLEEAATSAVIMNRHVADLIGINPAARTTMVKPEGSASLVLGTSSGIHAWHDDYYIRRMRFNKTEPVAQYLMDNLPYRRESIPDQPEIVEDDVMDPDNKIVLSIPVKAPDGAITRHEGALSLLERVKRFHEEWIRPGNAWGGMTNNVSTTVNLHPEESKDVRAWMFNNRYHYNGITVMDYDGGNYRQMPFESITAEEYERLSVRVPELDLTQVYEGDDNTNLAAELACFGGACELNLNF